MIAVRALALAALLTAAASVATLLEALRATAAVEAWATLAVLSGTLALALGAAAAGIPRPGPARGVALASGLAGLLVAALVLGQTAYVVARAFVTGGPSLAL